MEPTELFTWYQGINRLKTGVINKISHTESGIYGSVWFALEGVLHYVGQSGVAHKTQGGPREDRKPKKIFYEVT